MIVTLIINAGDKITKDGATDDERIVTLMIQNENYAEDEITNINWNSYVWDFHS